MSTHHTEVRYSTHDYWRGERGAQDARIDEIELIRWETRYPTDARGRVQWSRGERQDGPVLRIKIGEISAALAALTDTLVYHANGEVLADLGFDPARKAEPEGTK